MGLVSGSTYKARVIHLDLDLGASGSVAAETVTAAALAWRRAARWKLEGATGCYN